ncbi:Protein of uncharacterised function (DUF3558) [Mycobacteroides abscessus subsp. bolletii]|uniref:DUF3558 family protein n=1 Tax=Mycobacteroides abscessus TaxID=36809 RepID=UPI0009A69A51|nr:DUF3558 family protein [Mycobacteroides abscessus]SLF21374.1 Protein of uncharacterised function (DUF3558) [Mycobacteroides abscessus subsp. bolletii]
MLQLLSLVLTASAVTLALAGCTTTITPGDATMASSTPVPTMQTSPTATNTLPGPHPPPNDNNNGTSFDPCLAYTADELKSWGVAPGSVEDVGAKDNVQRGCTWQGEGWEVQQLVVNRSIDEFLNQTLFPGAWTVNIGGLTAALHRFPPDDMTVCYVELPSERATVGTIVGINSLQAQRETPDACPRAISIATDTAKKLPK